MRDRMTLSNANIKIEIEQIRRVFLGLNNQESSTFISPTNSEEKSNFISTERIEGRDYTKIGPIKKLDKKSVTTQ